MLFTAVQMTVLPNNCHIDVEIEDADYRSRWSCKTANSYSGKTWRLG